MSEGAPIVYIVDDDASVRESLKRLMKSVGLEARIYASGREFLQDERPDVPGCLVLDIRMPRMSGIELQRELALSEDELPIIFITGHGDVSLAVQAMKEGALDFLEKPFNDQDLIDTVQRAIDRHREAQSRRIEHDEISRRVDSLSPREREVLEFVITGMLNKQIAAELGTSEKTVKVHRARVMSKMEADSVAELVRLAVKIGIHGPGDITSR